MADLNKTQHFSENWEIILHNINFNPEEAVDPFAGNCDLVKYSPDTKWELYDIDVKKPEVQYRDSLLNPIDYTGKNVITNPPYLAKNKTNEFGEIFAKYQTDDLYKASILSIIGCEKGILIIPVNFFTDEATKEVREKFLSQYKVNYVNVFTKQVFANTTYNVCSFYFEKGETDEVTFYDYFKQTTTVLKLKKEDGYRIGGEFYAIFKNIKPVFSRVLKGEKTNTNLFISCTDTKNTNFHLEYKPGYVYEGKNTDRFFATLKCKKNLSEEEQIALASNFNSYVDTARNTYGNLLFTNYRDNGRKRISLDDVYKICTLLIK